MDTARICSICGKTLAANPPEGLCPECLLKAGLGTGADLNADSRTNAGESGFTPPPIAELAPLFPQLEILELIGKGGMGAVYKARQKELDRIVALKILPPDIGRAAAFAERFAREAKALARLNHPGIVTIHDFGRADGLYFFLMEFVDGVNLRQLLHGGRIPPREALAIVPQICEALQFAHDQGIVHRDIKPENLLMDRRGRVKVADFGLAKLIGAKNEPAAGEAAAAASTVLTESGKIMGTPNYMAPEQAAHPNEVDHRADIYALGVVFYQMLTGELPGQKIEPPSRKVQIDVRLDGIVLRALERKPELRYQQVSEVKTLVDTLVSEDPGENGVRRNPGGQSAPAGWAGYEYKSPRTWFGLPWLHVALGMDPVTGRQRIARGIIAIGGSARGVLALGGIARGVVAFGGLAMGGVAFGGLATGVVAIGGGALGLVSLGGLAIGLLAALGGGAAAPIALGGGAIGYYAFGGLGYGMHVLDSVTRDPAAAAFFDPWVRTVLAGVKWLVTVPLLVTAGLGVGLSLWFQRRIAARAASRANPGANPLPVSDFWQAVEAGDYGRAWDKTAPYFQRDQSRDAWIALMEKNRRPLGRSVERKLIANTIITPMTRTAVEVLARFANGQQLVEGVYSAVQPNGEWRVEKYYTRPATDEAMARARANPGGNPTSRHWKWFGVFALLAVAVLAGLVLVQGVIPSLIRDRGVAAVPAPADDSRLVINPMPVGLHEIKPGEIFWGLKCFIPPGHTASILFVRWTNGVPTVDPGFSTYFKVGEAGGIDVFCTLECYRVAATPEFSRLNADDRQRQLAAWDYPESAGVTNAVRWDVNLGAGFTASRWLAMPPLNRITPNSPLSIRTGHQCVIPLVGFDPSQGTETNGPSGVELRVFLEPLKSPPIRMLPNEVDRTNYVSGTGLAGTMEEAIDAIEHLPIER